ncbi:TPA: hypothetical protein ACX6QX_001563 [Photobacterium damselae]
MIKHITLALGAGFVGSVVNAIAIYLINPLQGLPSPDHIFSILGWSMGFTLSPTLV